jgi:alpha-amylase/alpha-mannosidase (GH57 family)
MNKDAIGLEREQTVSLFMTRKSRIEEKMKSRVIVLSLLFLVALISLSSCIQTTPSPTATSGATQSPSPIPTSVVAATPTTKAEEPIYLSIIWHQHQPVYYKDPETNIYAKPWVRVHAAKDYVDMAAMLQDYPNIHVSFNLTPSLIRQLDDFESGAKDLYWTIAEVPADQLKEEQKLFLLERFFDTNRKIIARFPRYQELLQKRDAGQQYTTQDYLDLQILFNLAWTDPDWLSQEPLASLVAKGSNFVEADKDIVFSEHLRLISEVIPVHRELQDADQIEVTMTPYAHPILPLLVSTRLALVANPEMDLPGKEFAYGQDAIDQVQFGVQLYKDHFGIAPRGMWPAEGSVAQEIVNMVSSAGIQWMASDEGVLAASLGMGSFTRDSKEVVVEADTLYRPYYVQSKQGNPVAIVFRDVVISDKVGFTYSGVSGSAAAKDFINRIHAIREVLVADGSNGPHLVSVILDGENAWENYDNDGKEFLNSLYAGLSADPLIRTVTPSEFLAIAPDQPDIEDLWAGSWINHDFTTWIGEDEENTAWDYLTTTRELLQKYLSGVRQTTAEAVAQAQNYMYIAEGSDWFWWFGSDQNSGNDDAFDQQFRDTLKQVYNSLGEQSPGFLDVPIIPLNPIAADITSSGLISVTVDGQVSPDEWDAAGVYQASGGVMASGQPYFLDLAYGFSSTNLFIKISTLPEYNDPTGTSSIELYFQVPGSEPTNNFSRNGTLLGFQTNRYIEILFQDGSVSASQIYTSAGNETWSEPISLDTVAQGENLVELGVPLIMLGNAETGDRISLRAIHAEPIDLAGTITTVDTEVLPGSGPAVLAVPDLGTMNLVLDISDPERDDYGPGTYTYPSDAVFQAGSYDILNFQVGSDTDNIVFKFAMRGPVENAWGSPNGLSIQTFDIYIDTNGDGQGGVGFLPGRNLALGDGFTWDYAITVEGWDYGIYTPGDAGPQKIATSSEFQVLADPGQQRVTIRIPQSILGDNPESWKYAAMVLSQEGYPSGGVMRVRDVNQSAEQWRFGGGSADTNHTRVIDLVWPEPGMQETWLSIYTASQLPQTELVVDDFARVEMLEIGQ